MSIIGGDSFVKWYSDHELNFFKITSEGQEIGEYRNVGYLESLLKNFNRPDAIMEYVDSKGVLRCVWIEMERTNKTIPRYIKLFEQNLMQYKTLKEPRLTEEDGLNYSGKHFNDFDYFFYIAGPHSPSMKFMLNARYKLAYSLITGDHHALLNEDVVDFKEDKLCRVVAEQYHDVTHPKFGLPDDLVTFEDYSKVFSRLPHLAPRNDLDTSKIRLFSWDVVKRSFMESKIYRESDEYRAIVDRYDPVKSFIQTYSEDEHGNKIDLYWIDKYIRPVKTV